MTTEKISNWQPPDGLGRSSLRPVRLTIAGRFMAGLVVAFVIGAPALGAFLVNRGRHESSERALLREQGVGTTAEITRVWRTRDEDQRYMTEYRFSVEGREFTGRTPVPRKIWSGLAVGASLPVRYLPGRPHINHPAAWERTAMSELVGIFVPFTLLLPAALLAFQLRKQMRLLSEGRAAPGTVTSLRRTDKGTIVKYEFQLLSGAAVKGRSQGGRKSPGVGSQICVLYDPDNPRRNTAYPLPFVRLDR